MQLRLADAVPPIVIPRSATNGWSASWKRFMIELAYARGMLVLYPSLFNQSSFSTNHLEAGEHVGSKSYRLKHTPSDFTVPLVHERAQLRGLWTDAAGRPRPLAPLDALPVLDLFSERSTVAAVRAAGARVVSAQHEQALGEGAAWAWRAAAERGG